MAKESRVRAWFSRGGRRRNIEDALRQSQARNLAILRALPDLVFVLSREGVYLDYHPGVMDPSGTPTSSLLGKNIRDVMPTALAERFLDAFHRLAHTSEPIAIDYTVRVGAGERSFEARLVRNERDRMLAIVRDVTDERIIRASNRELAGRLIASQETERQRIARELHDDLSQKLAVLNLEIDQFAVDVEALMPAIAGRVRDLSERVAEIASNIHELSYELHPARLDALGLVSAVQGLCAELSRKYGIAIDFIHDAVPSLSPDMALCLFRITQEALHNVVKHSGASRALVRLTRERDELNLQIADPGRGFDAELDGDAGLGLASMRERANFVGGRMALHTAPGFGTRIGVRVRISLGDARNLARPTGG